MIRGYIRGQSFRLTYPTMVSDTIAYREAEFFFDTPDWQGLVKWAHFAKGDEVYDILLKDDKIAKEDHLDLSDGEWQVYLHGNAVVDDVVVERITTTVQTMKVLKSGVLEGQPLPTLTPTAGEQVLAVAAEARSLAQSVRDDADRGLFKGEKGEKGEDGAPAEIAQSTGKSKTAVMSQDATTKQLDKKLNRVAANGENRIYAMNPDGSVKTYKAATSAHSWSVPLRNDGGRFDVGTPTEDNNCANKKYVDDKIGDIDTALATIIAIQSSLIGGDSE